MKQPSGRGLRQVTVVVVVGGGGGGGRDAAQLRGRDRRCCGSLQLGLARPGQGAAAWCEIYVDN